MRQGSGMWIVEIAKIKPAELVEIGDILKKYVHLLYRCFDGYASFDSKGDVDSISYNSYK